MLPRTYVIAITIVAVILVAFGFSFTMHSIDSVLPNNTQQEDDAASTAKVAARQLKIIYTDTGFQPTALSIVAGDTVTFVNQSNADMWIASDPYPTDTDYPQLDAQQRYTKGQSYKFSFTKRGSWGFHNQLNPNHVGRIIVR